MAQARWYRVSMVDSFSKGHRWESLKAYTAQDADFQAWQQWPKEYAGRVEPDEVKERHEHPEVKP